MQSVFKAVCLYIMVSLASCGPTDNYGYPDKISFGRDGGIREVSGNEPTYDIEIADGSGEGTNKNLNTDDSDSIKVTYKWLTVRAKKFEDKVTLIAEPNTNGKSRHLYVYGMVDDFDFEIKVSQ